MSEPTVAWSPTPLEVSIAQVAVLKEPMPVKADAIFIHGSPTDDRDQDRQLLSLAADYYHSGGTRNIAINGLTVGTCDDRKLAYPGFEIWYAMLRGKRVAEDDIVQIRPSLHTAAESIGLLEMARTKGWETIIISSQPHHQLRCFLQAVAVMQTMDFWPNVYNMTHGGIPWMRPLQKNVLNADAGGPVEGTIIDHIEAEYERLVKYAQTPLPAGTKGSFTRHATIPEMMAYLERRG